MRYLCCCIIRRRKRSFKQSLKMALRNKMEIATSKVDLAIEEDPFLLLGYGMNAYFEVVRQLLIMTAWLLIIIVPLMLMFASYDDLKLLPGYSFNQYSLGNMGGTDAFCGISTFHDDGMAIPIQCTTGIIDIDAVGEETGKPIFDAGIIPKSSSVNTYCANSAFEDPAKCSSYLKKDKLTQDIKSECIGKKQCQIKNLSSYIDHGRAGFSAEECDSDDSMIFI